MCALSTSGLQGLEQVYQFKDFKAHPIAVGALGGTLEIPPRNQGTKKNAAAPLALCGGPLCPRYTRSKGAVDESEN